MKILGVAKSAIVYILRKEDGNDELSNSKRLRTQQTCGLG